jgi:methylphosphotriester-DNA--protein-cysteine methyltransferase
LEERGYFWKDLRQRHLRACRRAVPTTKTDQEVATYAVLDVENLARIDTSPDQETLSRVAHEVGQALHQDAASVEARLRSVIATHAQEWQAFVEALPKHSWLRRVAER